MNLLNEKGITLPVLPTTTVGSFPKPDYITSARAKFFKGEITTEEMAALERKATEFWIKTQEELEIDILVDGEMYRGDMVAYFADNIKGFAISGFVRSYGNRFYKKPIIVDEIRWEKPVTVEWWKYTQSLTKKPVKGMLTGPYTVMDWSFNEYYPDRKSACLALAREIRKEVEALIEAGAVIIQIDEPAISVRPEELEFAREALDVVTKGLKAYFITHICYGRFDAIYPAMLNLPVDNLDLEMSNSELGLLDHVKKHPFTKDISYGVLDVHTHKVETKEEVKKRIKSGMEVIDLSHIWIGPDCGLKTRTVEESIDKLKVMMEAVKEVREEIKK